VNHSFNTKPKLKLVKKFMFKKKDIGRSLSHNGTSSPESYNIWVNFVKKYEKKYEKSFMSS